MKRLGLFVAASAMLLVNATAAGAQAVLDTSGSSMAATPLSGTVLLEDSGLRSYPAGYNETGRLARFSTDSRLSQDDINFSNRDFEAWKPMEVSSKNMIMGRLAGHSSRYHHPIADFSTGRLVRDMSQDPDGKLIRNEVNLANRDFEDNKALYAPTSHRKIDSRVRGLAVGSNLMEGRRVAVRVGPAIERSELWY